MKRIHPDDVPGMPLELVTAFLQSFAVQGGHGDILTFADVAGLDKVDAELGVE